MTIQNDVLLSMHDAVSCYTHTYRTNGLCNAARHVWVLCLGSCDQRGDVLLNVAPTVRLCSMVYGVHSNTHKTHKCSVDHNCIGVQ